METSYKRSVTHTHTSV